MRRFRYWLIRKLSGNDIIIGNAHSDMWTEGRSLVSDQKFHMFGTTILGKPFSFFENRKGSA